MFNLFRQILKLEPGITVGQWCWDRITNNWATLVALLGGAGMSYLAAVSTWLRPYAPLSWGIVGLVACLLIAVFFWLLARGRQMWVTTSINKSYRDSHHSVDPMQLVFQGKRIDINDLILPFHRVVKGKTFVDCDIYGPANVSVAATSPGRGSFNEGVYPLDPSAVTW